MIRAGSTLSLALVAGAIFSMAACGGDKSKAAAGDGTVVTPYIAIADTLASDSIDDLAQLGAAVIKASEDKQDKPGMAKVVQGAGRIAAQDIATARSAFKTMSEGMIEYLNATSDKQSGHMIVHCPMTFAGKGAPWVQKEGKVMNPYEGAMMLHCGDKVEWGAELPSSS